VSSVALAKENILLAELSLQIRKTHSEQLMPHISQLLEFASIKPGELSAIAVSIGPGSFTGLRIGLATAKALAYAKQIPLIGVPTLDALAYACPVQEVVIAPLLDAQKENVYRALFRWEANGLSTVETARVAGIDETVRHLAALDKQVMVLGEAAVMYRDRILGSAPNIILAPPHVTIPRASNVAMLGIELLKKGVRHDVMQLEPYYIRRSEAEVLWERRQGVVDD
jgi:tRNA threonylcarbamoyladenosine biosynthesis protein TsaB